jgi:GNAT superfamily N-acetyltransferase
VPIDAAGAAERNLLHAAALWAGAADGGQVDETESCTFVRCAVPLRSFNQVLVHRRPADVAGVVAETREYFRGVGGVFRLRIRDDAEPVSDAPFLGAGLQRRGGIPCLTAPTSIGREEGPFEIRAVLDEDTLAQHIDVVAAAFEWWRPDLEQVFRPSLLHATGWHAYVGYRDGVAVTTAQLIVEGGTAGLYYIGTVEGARSAGYGEAITRHALAEAGALGCTLAALQASPMGQPIYERIGFTRVSYYRSFVAAAS